MESTKQGAHTAESVERAISEALWPTHFVKHEAARQRAALGGVPFGRRSVKHSPRRGGVIVRRIVAYGMDYDDKFWSYAEIALLLNAGLSVVGRRD